jgi:hypothetical protein
MRRDKKCCGSGEAGDRPVVVKLVEELYLIE